MACLRSTLEYILTLSFLILIGILGHAKGKCLYHYGKCVEYCPPDMHPYNTRCDVDTLSQKTCATPETYVLGFTCGWARCDCDGDLVLSDHDGCVALADCELGPYRPRGSRRRKRRGKKFRLRVNEDLEDMHKNLEPVHMMGDMQKYIDYN